MTYYTPQDDSWTAQDAPPTAPPYLHISDDAPTLEFKGPSETGMSVSGAPAHSDTETVHTVAFLDTDLSDGLVLCALRARGQDLTVEDRRPSSHRTRHADAFEQLQSAMDEILIPVYVDDAMEEISESVDALVAIHTAQYASPPQGDCTYFRTALFRDGTLLLEAERGSL